VMDEWAKDRTHLVDKGIVHEGYLSFVILCRGTFVTVPDAGLEQVSFEVPVTCFDCLNLPWLGEPDDLDVTFEHAGYRCNVVRGPNGSLNGYVLVPATHPASALETDQIPVDVHGGLTWAGPFEGDTPDVLRLGFDCAHASDWTPAMPSTRQHGTYRDVVYVTAECKKLAEQLRKMEDAHGS